MPTDSHTPLVFLKFSLLWLSFVSTDLSILIIAEDVVGFTSLCVEDSWNSEKVNWFEDIATKNKMQGLHYCITLYSIVKQCLIHFLCVKEIEVPYSSIYLYLFSLNYSAWESSEPLPFAAFLQTLPSLHAILHLTL